MPDPLSDAKQLRESILRNANELQQIGERLSHVSDKLRNLAEHHAKLLADLLAINRASVMPYHINAETAARIKSLYEDASALFAETAKADCSNSSASDSKMSQTLATGQDYSTM